MNWLYKKFHLRERRNNLKSGSTLMSEPQLAAVVSVSEVAHDTLNFLSFFLSLWNRLSDQSGSWKKRSTCVFVLLSSTSSITATPWRPRKFCVSPLSCGVIRLRKSTQAASCLPFNLWQRSSTPFSTSFPNSLLIIKLRSESAYVMKSGNTCSSGKCEMNNLIICITASLGEIERAMRYA